MNVFQRLLTVSQNINATFITQKITALKGSRHLLLNIVLNLGKATELMTDRCLGVNEIYS